LRESVGDAVCHTGDDAPGIAVTDQNRVLEVFELEDVDDVCDVRIEVHVGLSKVDPLAQSRQGDGIDLVPTLAQIARDVLPDPPTEPRPRD
jgi:hypothetical protein